MIELDKGGGCCVRDERGRNIMVMTVGGEERALSD